MGNNLPILYSFRRCPYAIRARMALLHAGVVCELREVSLKNKPEAMLHASPKGTVPVLVLPDLTVIEESLDIMLWVYSSNDLLNTIGSLNIDFIDKIQTDYVPLVTQFKYLKVEQTDKERVQLKERLESWMQQFETVLTKAGSFSPGQWGLTDLAVFPFIRQCASVDPEWFRLMPCPHLHQWLDVQLQSDLFIRCMQKEQPWQPGATPVRLPREECQRIVSKAGK